MPPFPVQITLVCPGQEPQVYPLHAETITVGRSLESSLVLTDESVSTRHAEIVSVDGDYVLRDLQSSNGTALNGQRITEARLKDGDRITFGGVECVFQKQRGAEAFPETKEEAVSPSSSFGSKLARLGKAALKETKRNARLIAIKAKIEKLKRIDLAKAHYALGVKAYALKPAPDRFAAQYSEIDLLEQKINACSVAPSPDGGTTSEKVKEKVSQAKTAAQKKALSLTLRQKLIALGQRISAATEIPELSTEMNGALAVNSRITVLEKEFAKVADANNPQVRSAKRVLILIGVITLCGTIGLLLKGWMGGSDFNTSYASFDERVTQKTTIRRLYADSVPFFDQPVAVEGIIYASAGSGMEKEFRENRFYKFAIKSLNPRVDGRLVAFLDRRNGSALINQVSVTGERGMRGVFVIVINRHTPNVLGYDYRNPLYGYIECELLGYGPNLSMINKAVQEKGRQTASLPARERQPAGQGAGPSGSGTPVAPKESRATILSGHWCQACNGKGTIRTPSGFTTVCIACGGKGYLGSQPPAPEAFPKQ